jgi:trimeric autotransporter adhesin
MNTSMSVGNPILNFRAATSGNPQMVILNSGNVGIGTTGPGAMLDVEQPTTTASPSLIVSKSYSGGGNAISTAQFTATDAGINASVNLLNKTASGWAILNASNAARTNSVLYVLGTGTGSVGLGGTTAPTNLLSLDGTAARTIWMERNTTAATAGQGLTLSSGGAIAGTADLAGGDLTLKSGTSTGLGTSAMHFYTATAGATGTTDRAPTEKMTILGSGNVGIGTTAPGAPLEVKQGVQAALTLPLVINDGFYQAGSASGIGFLTDGTASYTKGALVYASNGSGWNIGDFQFLLRNDSTVTPVALTDAKMTIKASGNVGIGTTTPANALDIGTGGGIHITSGIPASTTAALYNNAGTLTWNGTAVGGGSPIWTHSGTNDYLTTTTDNVGIGTATPLSKLSVGGQGIAGVGIYSTRPCGQTRCLGGAADD